MSVRSRTNWLGSAVAAGILLVWELTVRLGIVTFDYIPAPSAIVARFGSMLSSGELMQNLQHTLTATLLGWLLASLVGVALGTMLGLSHLAWTYSMSSVDALRALPVVAFVPVAVLLSGFTLKMEILVSAYSALWPVLLNTLAGVRSTHPRLLETGKVLGMGRLAQLWKLRLPAAAPHIVVGLRLGLANSLVLTLVAEMVGNPQGIGYALIADSKSLQPERMFVSIFAIGIAGIVLNAVLIGGARLLARGQMASSGELT
jgi:ABC-type nitrate/sulfonate/bicarbonate transport system permease component